MSVTDGIVAQGDTTGITNTNALFDMLIALIPNPDAPHGSGAIQGGAGGGNLDEMSPAAAAQLRVELTAAKTFANNATVPGV